MIIDKQFLSEKLIEGYINAPLSLKEQTFTKLAIQLCKNSVLKKVILAVSEPMINYSWEWDVKNKSISICKQLRLPPALETSLILHIRSIAIQLFCWHRKYRIMFGTSHYVTDRYLMALDWTEEGRIDERKVAERLVDDDTISVCQRYKIACVYFLDPAALHLWDQIPKRNWEKFFLIHNSAQVNQSEVVWLWSCRLAKKEEGLYRFWQLGFEESVREGEISGVTYCWEALSESSKEEVIIRSALTALSMYTDFISWQERVFCSERSSTASPMHYSDILYFLISHMSEKQRIEFFKVIITKNYNMSCFLQSPNQEYFMPVITKMWDIITEIHYGRILLIVADRYTNIRNRNEYLDYDYGSLLIELLEKTPDYYKRYIFRIEQSRLELNEGKKILFKCFEKYPFKCLHIKVIQRILQQATVKEKYSIMYSVCGIKLCKYFILNRKQDILDSLLADCVPEKALAHYKKRIIWCLDHVIDQNLFSNLQ